MRTKWKNSNSPDKQFGFYSIWTSNQWFRGQFNRFINWSNTPKLCVVQETPPICNSRKVQTSSTNAAITVLFDFWSKSTKSLKYKKWKSVCVKMPLNERCHWKKDATVIRGFICASLACMHVKVTGWAAFNMRRKNKRRKVDSYNKNTAGVDTFHMFAS